MHSQESLTQVAKRWYESLRKPLIVILVFLAFVARYLNIPITKDGAMLAAALLLINMLFEIHDLLLKDKAPTRFTRFHGAAIHFRKQVEQRATPRKVLSLKWLGMSMEYGCPFLDDMLSNLKRHHRRVRIELTVVMIDPEWPILKELNDTWPSKAQSSVKSMASLLKRIGTDSPHDITVELYFYRHVPNWHGFVINDRFVYLSTCSWQEGRLLGGEVTYELIDAQADNIAAERVKHFLGWFDYCKQIPLDLTKI
jgi:hypothetical protein